MKSNLRFKLKYLGEWLDDEEDPAEAEFLARQEEDLYNYRQTLLYDAVQTFAPDITLNQFYYQMLHQRKEARQLPRYLS